MTNIWDKAILKCIIRDEIVVLYNDSFLKKAEGGLVICTLGYVSHGDRCKNKPNTGKNLKNTNLNNNKIILTCVFISEKFNEHWHTYIVLVSVFIVMSVGY